MNVTHVVSDTVCKLSKTLATLTGLIASYYYLICFIGAGGPFELYAAFLWSLLTLAIGTVSIASGYFVEDE